MTDKMRRLDTVLLNIELARSTMRNIHAKEDKTSKDLISLADLKRALSDLYELRDEIMKG